MANPLYNLLGSAIQNTPMGNMMNMMQQFKQFRNSFKGDPKQQIQQLLDSGQMSQDQFNQLQQIARQFRQIMK